MEFILADGLLRRIKWEEKGLIQKGEFTGEIIKIDDTEEITIPDGTKEIHFNTDVRFTNEMFCCKNTKKVILPDGLEVIGKEAFREWEKLETVNLPESLKVIGSCAFYKTALKKVVIPENVDEIDRYAFGYCQELEEILFPKSQTELVSSLVNHCKKLKSIDIPTYLTVMLQLSGCGFESFVIPEGIESVYPGQFNDCKNLKDIVFPSTLERQDIYAFEDCDVLESITFKKYLKPFTISLGDIPSLKRLNVPLKDTVKAKMEFPKLIIGDLEGNIVYNADDKVSEKDKPRERKKPEKKQEDPMDDSVLHNRSIDIEQNGKVYHIDIKGIRTITRTVNKYIKDASGEEHIEFYDPMELVNINHSNLFTIESHTGERVPRLGQYRSRLDIPGSYSDPISLEEVIKRTKDFESKALKCLSNENIEKILSKVPHKKNGTLHKNRTSCILKLNCVDEDAMVCMIYAKNKDDTTMEINVKQFYVGDNISLGSELAADIL